MEQLLGQLARLPGDTAILSIEITRDGAGLHSAGGARPDQRAVCDV
jgi:hypothetical protein